MKKRLLYSLLLCLMAMFMCTTFTACGDDDDPTENVKTEQTETDKENSSSTEPPVTHPNAVDLGLSVKWASCNVEATTPEEIGGHYAWGETEEKEDYTWETYKFGGQIWGNVTKYCINSNNHNNGVADNLTTLEPCDDVAHVKWGGSWRMPTKEEQDELREECAWEWTTINNVKGYKITGPNGNSIFLPATGGSIDTYIPECGFYWSSSLWLNIDGFARLLQFSSEKHTTEHDGPREQGFAVRPVCE